MEGPERGKLRQHSQSIGLLVAPILAVLVHAALPDAYRDATGAEIPIHSGMRATAAIAVWMAIWWMTEAIPLYATALLPLALFPATGAASMRDAASPYAHELIFLFMGGFILALSMQRWGLDRRISLMALRVVGSRPNAIVGGFMAVTAAMSMWVSNTATAVMMLPIAIGVIELVEGNGRAEPENAAAPSSAFATCLLLGIAYAASIGGVGTIIGTPPNLFLVSYAKSNLGIEISFVRWMAIGLPLVFLFLPVAWLLLTRFLFPVSGEPVEGGHRHIEALLRELGPVKRGEWITLVVFAVTAVTWISRPWLVELRLGGLHPFAGLTDPGVAIMAALALFVIPVDASRRIFAMDWETANKLPWGLLLLFGGGLSLAAAIRANGLGEYIGHSVGFLGGVPTFLVVGALATLIIFLTELTSNTATTATFVPILASLAPAFDTQPLLLVVPAAIAASCAFMLPVATPPNAVVFGSGRIRLPDMCRAGIWLNFIGILIITLLCYWLTLPLLGVEPGG